MRVRQRFGVDLAMVGLGYWEVRALLQTASAAVLGTVTVVSLLNPTSPEVVVVYDDDLGPDAVRSRLAHALGVDDQAIRAVRKPVPDDRGAANAATGGRLAPPRPLPSADRDASPADTAHPRVDAPDIVVAGAEFDAVIGLRPDPDATLEETGAMRLAATVDVDVVLSVDPYAFDIVGPTNRWCLHRTPDEPDPAVTVRLRALPGRMRAHRRLRVQYLLEGSPVGAASRVVTVLAPGEHAADPADVLPGAAAAIDLRPPPEDGPPDLVLLVHGGDDVRGAGLVFTVVAAPPGVELPQRSETRALDGPDGGDREAFALQARDAVDDAFYQAKEVRERGHRVNGRWLFSWLEGYGRGIDRAMPPGFRQAVRRTVESGRTTPAAILVVTDDPYLPWELAVPEPALQTPFGGGSRFLGAHALMSRWITDRDGSMPRHPPVEKRVASMVVVGADYEGAAGLWGELPHAKAEADHMRERYGARPVDPEFDDVLELLAGKPAADVLHFALHGMFDHARLGGLVLVNQGINTTNLTPSQVQRQPLAGDPFVFLNACQVGAAGRVLGDYSGMAGAFLQAGAAVVLAPLWTIDDGVAVEVAHAVYDGAYRTQRGTPLAEVLRALRSRVTETAAQEQDERFVATLLAYQLYGHPRARLCPAAPGQQPAVGGA